LRFTSYEYASQGCCVAAKLLSNFQLSSGFEKLKGVGKENKLIRVEVNKIKAYRSKNKLEITIFVSFKNNFNFIVLFRKYDNLLCLSTTFM